MKNDDLISRSERLRQIRQTEPDDYRSAMLISDAKKVMRTFIEEAPAADAVSRSVFEQIKWERDCAMQQLKDHGIPFGGIAPAVDAREKLIELLKHAPLMKRTHGVIWVEAMGQWLIDNGVTFAKDTDVPSKWISVEERLPTEEDADDDLCVLAIHKATPRRYFHWLSVANNPFDFTHWMPVPEPPRVQGVPNGTDHA